MRIRTGGFGDPVAIVDTSALEVLSEDNRVMFYIYGGKDGISIEIIAGMTFKAHGVVYDNKFAIHPNAANSITLRPVVYK